VLEYKSEYQSTDQALRDGLKRRGLGTLGQIKTSEIDYMLEHKLDTRTYQDKRGSEEVGRQSTNWVLKQIISNEADKVRLI